MAQIQLSIVTPETTTFDESVDSVIVPLIDGEKGILAGHSPMIGRLGPGELRVGTRSGQLRFYVDGGFVQIADNVVSVLTGNSIPADELDIGQAKSDLEKAQAMETGNRELMELKRKAVAQATAQIRMAEKV